MGLRAHPMRDASRERGIPRASGLPWLLTATVLLAAAMVAGTTAQADARVLSGKGFYIAGSANGCVVLDRVLWCSTTAGAREPWFSRLPARGTPTARRTPGFEGVRPPARSPRLRAPGTWRARGGPFLCRWSRAQGPIVCRSTASGRSIRILRSGRILVR